MHASFKWGVTTINQDFKPNNDQEFRWINLIASHQPLHDDDDQNELSQSY